MSTLKLPITLSLSLRKVDPNQITQGWVDDKPCLVSVGTEVYVTVARPDIAAGWSQRQENQRYTLQNVSGKALSILKKVFLTIILVRNPLNI